MCTIRYVRSIGILSIIIAASVPNRVAVAQDNVTALRESILAGPYGKCKIEDLVTGAAATADPTRREMRLALLLRRQESIPVLKQRLLDGSNLEKYEILMLIQRDLRWRDFEPTVLEVLRDTDQSDRVRGRAATACALFQRGDSAPAIRGLLRTAKEDQARQWAAMALGVLRDAESEPLIQGMLDDPSPYVRVTASMVLGMFGNSAGQAVALAASRDESFGLRCRAAEALAKIGTPQALDRLKEMAKTDGSPTVRTESTEHLAVLEIEKLDSHAAIERLQGLLAPDKPNPPPWAFAYLVDHFGNDVKPFLRSLAERPGLLQQAASLALFRIDSNAVQLPHGRRPHK